MGRISTIFLFLAWTVANAVADPVPNTELAKATVVVCTNKYPPAVEAAKEYAKLRGIPDDQVVVLDCTKNESIKRQQFIDEIARPLKAKFAEKGWWTMKMVDGGQMVATENKIRVLTLVHGIPLRIQPTPGPVDPKTKKPTRVGPQQTDAACVDSELAALGMPGLETKGVARNPYFRQNDSIAHLNLPMLMLVARLDGPGINTTKRLYADAMDVEETGLWGRAYVDLARLELTKGKAYKMGDDVLRKTVELFHIAGVPVYVDGRPERLAPHFPMGDDVIFYYGWYTGHYDGPFKHGDFRFRKGAVASHLHSFSATSVRRPDQAWCGPLLARGACATLGNVWEPFLTLTTSYDLFTVRLMEGYTFVEAAWMATPGLSWMNTFVGDPLYQPFERDKRYPDKENVDFKAMRLAAVNWNKQPDEIRKQTKRAAEQLKSPVIYESLGLRAWDDVKNKEALEHFAKAKDLYEKPADKLRIRLHEIGMMRGNGKKEDAMTALRGVKNEFKDVPEAEVAKSWINQLEPPPPPMPKPK